MKKLIIGAVIAVTVLSGCTAQERAKSMGGTMTITLEAGEKLEEITWKDDNLWYLVRPMREDEVAETHKFKQDSSYGLVEGTVIIEEVAK